jgi:hypothetical protein
LANAQNAEESTPCTLSSKIKPDSRGFDPGIHEAMQQTKPYGSRPWIVIMDRPVGDDDGGYGTVWINLRRHKRRHKKMPRIAPGQSAEKMVKLLI